MVFNRLLSTVWPTVNIAAVYKTVITISISPWKFHCGKENYNTKGYRCLKPSKKKLVFYPVLIRRPGPTGVLYVVHKIRAYKCIGQTREMKFHVIRYSTAIRSAWKQRITAKKWSNCLWTLKIFEILKYSSSYIVPVCGIFPWKYELFEKKEIPSLVLNV